MKDLKIVFMGTPDFSAEVLSNLAAEHNVVAAVTGPDKPVGRGYALRPSPLKVRAAELGIPVLQYEKVSRDGLGEIAALAPDLGVTAAFGQILSEKFLSLFPLGVLNVHASLLPKYRGASPIQWALLNGDHETGVTIMRTVKEVDAGDILLQKRIPIGEKETAGELFDSLAKLGGEAICEAVDALADGRVVFTPQNAAEATHCGMITKADGKIDFRRGARELDCFVRGMTPWPSAWFELGGKRVKVFAAERAEGHGTPGEVIAASPAQGLVVACGDGAVRLAALQPEGKSRMSDTAYLMGHGIEKGTVLQ